MEPMIVNSPNGSLQAIVVTGPDGRLRYEVKLGNAAIIETSELGVTLKVSASGGDATIDLGAGAVPGDVQRRSVEESYSTRGWHTTAVNHYNEAVIPLTHAPSGSAYELHVRVFNDGAAYRYAIPGDGVRIVAGESSSWTLPADSLVWFFERNSHWKLKSYAGEWMTAKAEQLHAVSSQGPLQGAPLVVKLPESRGYAVITEAALYNYSGMRLEALGDRKLKANFTEGEEGFRVEGGMVTPWRVTIYSPDLDGLVNSDVIANLNPPASPALFPDTSYIKPGRSVWRWWSLGTGTPEQEREMIDHAASLGYEYTTIDEGWEKWDTPWDSLRQLTAYARERGVGVFVWKRSKEIDDPRNDYKIMRRFFDQVKAAGVKGMKIDFIDNEAKAAVDFETRALQLAAERKLMINFHGISKPTGESRTYPNEITREGIRGLELNKMSEGPIPAWHNAALPFTRFLTGHGDYTPVGYSNPGRTTYAHQLATAVVFTSPMQVIAENPAFLLDNMNVRPALDIMQELPSVWDETRVLAPSEIGKIAAFARRSGDTWYVAIVNGTEQRMTFEQLELSFLADGEYDLVRWEDAEGGTAALTRREERLTSGQRTIQAAALPTGGFVARLSKSQG